MKVTGTMNLVTKTGRCIMSRRYHCKQKRDSIINRWSGLYAVKLLTRFIHIVPDAIQSKIDSEIVNKLIMPKITIEQLSYIKQHRGKTPAKEVAKFLGIPVTSVYYYNKEFTPVKDKEILVLPSLQPEKKEPNKRPPSNYSNSRFYETF